MPSGVKDIQLLELKDTISQLNKTISTQNELISSLQKMLEERNAKDSEKDLLIANLQSQLAYLKNKVFGSTSEIRHDQLDGQLNLFGTPVGDEKPAEVIEPEVISVKGYTKERKPKATYRIRRHFLLCPMNHSKEKWRFAMVICGRMELVQILLAMLNCLAEKGNCADFAPFPVQIRNWVFCIKPQITNFHIEELTAPGGSIVHEDHKYQSPQIFRLRWVRLLKQRSQ